MNKRIKKKISKRISYYTYTFSINNMIIQNYKIRTYKEQKDWDRFIKRTNKYYYGSRNEELTEFLIFDYIQ